MEVKTKKFFNIIPGADACSIFLYGDISDSYGTVTSAQIAQELMTATATYKNINIRINSIGGEVYAGIAIFNALRASEANITLYVDGVAASMASVIALCGKPVYMSRYARLMLHCVSGGCYGNTKDMKDMIAEMESLEDTLCDMYASKLGKDKESIKATYFDGKDHWLTATEAKNLGFIDGIYDAEPVPEESTPEQIYAIFNNRRLAPQNNVDMNLEELKKRPQFKDCATEAEVLARIGQLEAKASKVSALEQENTSLKEQVQTFEQAAEEAAAADRKTLLDAAEQDGRINAETRPIYEKLLKDHPEDGEKALAALPTKKMVKDTLPGSLTPEESPWEKRQREIRDKFHGKL
ncbi:Clp protease ClpP [Alloprevotella tannerae]|jgi:ATP-dependent Clp protease, proteolytic subunit ClpP|uniref:head maturation protease, ClpP-related n=1 Tax=Alloprevotella tannerae TaxID=76122 RepID=UPI001CB348B0|nr:head maturation protease, ClpP-related [Alloprevotella tannerae]MBF0951057.1 Clp protease ClpP [Alloprevotella tannerae]MCG2651932.1 Clp protease ClpP [Alloprevotella tannerae]DAN56252.1 MAG TPA: putative ATP dependent Clp protease [Caudoviricetes sp.]